MSSIQWLLLSILSHSLGKDIEKESRLWMQRCRECGAETSIWEDGGVRFGAAGRPWRLRRCATCGLQWHEVYKRTGPTDDRKSA
jgi:hypothetical protein